MFSSVVLDCFQEFVVTFWPIISQTPRITRKCANDRSHITGAKLYPPSENAETVTFTDYDFYLTVYISAVNGSIRSNPLNLYVVKCSLQLQIMEQYIVLAVCRR